MFGLPSHIHVFCWSAYPCKCICVAGRGGITRINGTNAVHLEAIDHGTVQPSTQMYQYFPEQPIDLLSSRGCIIKMRASKNPLLYLPPIPFVISRHHLHITLLCLNLFPFSLLFVKIHPSTPCFKNEVLFEDDLCWYLQERANNCFAKNAKNLLFVTKHNII